MAQNLKDLFPKYTLSKEELEAYDRDGFIVMQGLIPPEKMELVTKWTDDIFNWKEEKGRHMVYYEDSLREKDKRIVQRVENFLQYSPEFNAIHEYIQDICTQLFGEQATCYKEKINYKLPGGDGFKPHQDSSAGWETYSKKFVSVLLSIDASTIENGCLQLVRGEHKKGLLTPEWTPIPDEMWKKMKIENLPTKPGDVVFFDSYTPHGSEENKTDKARRILYLSYNPKAAGDFREQYYIDKRKNFPPEIEREPGVEYKFKV